MKTKILIFFVKNLYLGNLIQITNCNTSFIHPYMMIGNIQIQKEVASLLQIPEFLIQVKIIGDYDDRSWLKKLWEKQILSLTNGYD